jgi:hypothetical protein
VFKSKRIGWDRHVARMEEIIYAWAYKILVGKPEVK